MNRITYDLAMLAGTAMASAGCGLIWGLGAGLLCGGGLVIVLTIVGVALTGKGR